MRPIFDNTKKVKPLNRTVGTEEQMRALGNPINNEDSPAHYWVKRKGNGQKGKKRTTDHYYRSYKPEEVQYPAAGEYVLEFTNGSTYPVAGKPKDFQKVLHIEGSKDRPLGPDEEPMPLSEVYKAQDRRSGARWFQRRGKIKRVWVDAKSHGGGRLAYPGTGGAWCATDDNEVPIPVQQSNKGGK